MKSFFVFLLVTVFSFNFISSSAHSVFTTYFEQYSPLSPELGVSTYYGKDSSDKNHKVHLLEYKPGAGTLPLISFGTSMLSHKTVLSMMKTEAERGYNVAAGINGDFYSFYTGIPLGAVVIDGKLLSSDAGNNAIGFLPDGGVIIGKPEIKLEFSFSYKNETEEDTSYIQLNETETDETIAEEIFSADSEENSPEVLPNEEAVIPKDDITTLTDEGNTESSDEKTSLPEADAEEREEVSFSFNAYYNKYPTVYAVYLTDPNYSKTTASDFPCREYVLVPSGDVPLSGNMEFKVAYVYNKGNNEIPEGAVIMTVPNALKNAKDFDALCIGDVLEVQITCAKGWESVALAIGGGDVFVSDSTFLAETVDEDHEKYKNARTAVGVRSDGSVIFVAVDGDGKSGVGMNMRSLAKFMISEGAVTCLNLDGGGSTTVAVSFPSEDEIKVLTTPKDGSNRRVSNSVLFVNTYPENTDKVFADLELSDSFWLAGSKIPVSPVFYSGDGRRLYFEKEDYDSIVTSAVYIHNDSEALVRDNVYMSVNKPYIERLWGLYDFDGIPVEAFDVINVVDKVDTLSFDRREMLLEEGNTYQLTVNASYLGYPVYADFDLFAFGDDLPVTELTQETEIVAPEETVVSETEKASDEPVDAPVGDSTDAPTEEPTDTPTEELTDIIFENEYFSINRTGVLTAKNAPMFTSFDLNVSYNDTQGFLTLYFGKKPEILDSFEYSDYKTVISDSGMKIREKGFRSDSAVFAGDGNISYLSPVTLDILPEYFIIYVKGNYTKGLFSVISYNGETYLLPYYVYKDYSDVSGWTALIAPLPEDIEGRIELLCPIISNEGKPFTADNFTAYYGWSTDPFSDIGGIWSHDYIVEIYEMGLVNGYVENNEIIFKPENNITRAEFAKMLASYLSLDIESYSGYGSAFADEGEIAEWASGYIKALSTEGYMNGKSSPDGTLTFDSDSFITRQEAMHVFSKLLKDFGENIEIVFIDPESVEEWAAESVRKVVGAGIVTGFDDGTIRAGEPVTRAQMCTMFMRLWNLNK